MAKKKRKKKTDKPNEPEKEKRVHPELDDFDPHAQEEYEESDRRAFDPHTGDGRKPEPSPSVVN